MTAKKARSELWSLIFKTVPFSAVLNIFSVTIAYFFYDVILKKSMVPGKLALVMLGICIAGPLAIGWADRGVSRLRSIGLAGVFAIASVYFTFGVTLYYFYFLFAPMPMFAHVMGAGVGLVLTIYWMVITGLDVRRVLATSNFVKLAFEDAGDVFHYKLANMAKLEPLLSKRSPSGRLHMWLVLLVTPFSLVLGRILSPYFGANGPLFIAALILFPVSQWVAGLMVRQYLVMIRLPSTLERLHGKPVVVIG